jgi:hypothetical protein
MKVPASKTGSAAREGPASWLVSGGARVVEVITCSLVSVVVGIDRAGQFADVHLGTSVVRVLADQDATEIR